MVGQVWGWENIPTVNHANSEDLFGTDCIKLIWSSSYSTFTEMNSYDSSPNLEIMMSFKK